MPAPVLPRSPAETARLNRLLSAAIAGGILLGTFVFAHSSIRGPVCMFRVATNLPCPGCGLTRSLMALWHGNLALSFRYHPLGSLVFVASAAAVLLAVIPAGSSVGRLGARVSGLLGTTRAQYALLALLTVVWLVRVGSALYGGRFFLY